MKIIDMVNAYACVAIYEPHPFRNCVIQEAVQQNNKNTTQHTGIDDDQWCWVYYDWCGNPIGMSADVPEGRLVYQLKPEDFEWMGHDNAVRWCEYLNKENEEIKKQWEQKYGDIEVRE